MNMTFTTAFVFVLTITASPSFAADCVPGDAKFAGIYELVGDGDFASTLEVLGDGSYRLDWTYEDYDYATSGCWMVAGRNFRMSNTMADSGPEPDSFGGNFLLVGPDDRLSWPLSGLQREYVRQ